jgi:hypothetical protein
MWRTCKISYISWVAWSISSLVVFTQVIVFVIAQVSNSKAISKIKITWTLYVWLLLGLRNEKCSYWKAIELFQMSWTSSTKLSFFTWVELLQLSWAFSAALNFFSWVELQLQLWNSLTKTSLTGVSYLNFLVKTGWTGPYGRFNRSLGHLRSLTCSLSVS